MKHELEGNRLDEDYSLQCTTDVGRRSLDIVKIGWWDTNGEENKICFDDGRWL